MQNVMLCVCVSYAGIWLLDDTAAVGNTNTHVYVCCVEDSFVNSQEWTLSRAVPDLKLVSNLLVLFTMWNVIDVTYLEFWGSDVWDNGE